MVNPVQRFMLSVLMLYLVFLAGQLLSTWVKNSEKDKPKDTLMIGMLDDSPPFCFYSADNQLVGISIDMTRELGKRMGKKVKIDSLSFNRLVSGLRTKQYDMVIIGSVTPKRAKVVRYLNPHDNAVDVLTVRHGLGDIKDIDGLKKTPYKIGVYNGSSYIQLIKDHGLEANMVIYPNQRDMFMAFFKQRVDAVIMNETVARYMAHEHPQSMVIAPTVVRADRKIAFALNPENLALWKSANQAVTSIVEDGTFQRIKDHWTPDDRLTAPSKKAS